MSKITKLHIYWIIGDKDTTVRVHRDFLSGPPYTEHTILSSIPLRVRATRGAVYREYHPTQASLERCKQIAERMNKHEYNTFLGVGMMADRMTEIGTELLEE
jgi:hypothetical protein